MLAPGQIIDGKYRIERCLAEGGMGAVFLGQNTRIGRQVAIKVLHGSLAKQGVQVERFEQEAQLLARIGSQYIVEVLDMGDLAGGDSYMVMEYLEGESLGERLQRRRRLTPEESATLVEQALAGLEAAHGAGVVHRDIKPDNLFLVRRAEGELVKILDFGVSKINEAAATNIRQSKLTLNGTLVGTPQYMSPEQARGHATDHRTDVFAMGIVLFECVAGETPFVGDNMQDLLFRVALEEPRTLSSLCPDIDPGFEAIVRRATARLPDDRYPTARDFRDAVRGWLDERGVVSVRPRTPTHLRRIVPTPAHLPSQARSSDTPANWSTPPRGIASRPDLEADDAAAAGLPRRRTPWVIGGVLAAAAAAAVVFAGLSSPSAAPAAAAEPPPAVAVATVAPTVTPTEAPAVAAEPARTTATRPSGASGHGSLALATQGALAAQGVRGRGLPGAAASADAAKAAAAASVAPPPAASAPAAVEGPITMPPSPEASPAAPPPAAPPPAAPPPAAAPVQATGPSPAVIPSTPKGRVFRRDL